MMFLDNEYIIQLLIVIIFFSVQLYLSIKINSIWIKLIPIYIIVLAIIFSVFIFMTGDGDWGSVLIPMIIFIWGIIPAVIGDLIAWIVYQIYKIRQRS